MEKIIRITCLTMWGISAASSLVAKNWSAAFNGFAAMAYLCMFYWQQDFTARVLKEIGAALDRCEMNDTERSTK